MLISFHCFLLYLSSYVVSLKSFFLNPDLSYVCIRLEFENDHDGLCLDDLATQIIVASR